MSHKSAIWSGVILPLVLVLASVAYLFRLAGLAPVTICGICCLGTMWASGMLGHIEWKVVMVIGLVFGTLAALSLSRFWGPYQQAAVGFAMTIAIFVMLYWTSRISRSPASAMVIVMMCYIIVIGLKDLLSPAFWILVSERWPIFMAWWLVDVLAGQMMAWTKKRLGGTDQASGASLLP